MTTQEREQLKSYIELCSSLEKHSFFVGTDKLVITVPQNPSQKSKLGGYEEESLTSFLVPFRKTYMNDETTFFHSIGNIISRRKVKLRPVIKELKTRYSEALKKAKAISSDPKIDIVDAFINGKYFHTGEESKKDVIKDEYDLKKQAFLLALFD